jgi:molybdenum cofactor guanylyltransferase
MQQAITTVILAGGLGKRIGGNKGMKILRGRPLIAWVLDAVRRHSNEVLINVNGACDEYAQFGHRIIADQLPGWAGPLAGLHTALHSAKNDWVACVPCDTPFLPDDLLDRLLSAATTNATEAAVAFSDGVPQPVIGLYHKSVLPSLDAFLNAGGRKVSDWQSTLHLSEVVFDNADALFNINSQNDLNQANTMSEQRKN